MKTQTDLQPEDELLGYRVERVIGRGGMGVVYLAEQVVLDRLVALKLLTPGLAADGEFRERFLRESRLAASLDHPNIVPVFDAGEVDGRLYIAMRYVEGRDLGELLAAQEAPLEPERALSLLAPVAKALDAAHARRLVHRDVKPSNVLVDTEERPYLADFGLTKETSEKGLVEQSHFAASVGYVAPEQIEGDPVDGRADQYALACVLYECLSGATPFANDSTMATLWGHLNDQPPQASERNPELPNEVDAVFERALAKSPEERYLTCAEFADAVRGALPRSEPEQPSGRRRVLLAAIATLTAIALAALLAVLLTRNEGDTAPSSEPTVTPTTDSIQRIDPDTNEIVATIAAPVSEWGIAAGGGWVWTASSDEETLARIDPEKNAVVETLSGIADPAGIAIHDGSLWVLNRRDGIVTQHDPQTGTVRATIPLPPGAGVDGNNIRGYESGVWLYWLTVDSNLVVIDPSSARATPVQIGSPNERIFEFASTGPDRLWALLPGLHDIYDARLVSFDLERTGQAGTMIPLTTPTYVCTASSGDYVWIADFVGDVVFQVDTRSRRVLRRIPVGNGPCEMAVGHRSVWVTNKSSGTVSRIDPDSGDVGTTIYVGPNPSGIAADENAVWVEVHPS